MPSRGDELEGQDLLNDEEKRDLWPAFESRAVTFRQGSSRKYAGLFMTVLLLCSLSLNTYQAVTGHFKSSAPMRPGQFSNVQYDLPIVVQATTEYQGKNHSETDHLWESIDTSAAAVAIPDEWALQHNLPLSERFPWDNGKGMYFVKGIHQMHCLKLLYRTITSFYRYGKPALPEPHILHCLDALRQDLKCYADDTPMLALAGKKLGDQQPLVCRNWDSMIEWARQPLFEACWSFGDEYRDIEHRIERYAFCDKDSKYYPAMKEFFDVHGHQNPYPANDEVDYSRA